MPSLRNTWRRWNATLCVLMNSWPAICWFVMPWATSRDVARSVSVTLSRPVAGLFPVLQCRRRTENGLVLRGPPRIGLSSIGSAMGAPPKQVHALATRPLVPQADEGEPLGRALPKRRIRMRVTVGTFGKKIKIRPNGAMVTPVRRPRLRSARQRGRGRSARGRDPPTARTAGGSLRGRPRDGSPPRRSRAPRPLPPWPRSPPG
jgi:hypothetical protein